jgi:hypothetical protein
MERVKGIELLWTGPGPNASEASLRLQKPRLQHHTGTDVGKFQQKSLTLSFQFPKFRPEDFAQEQEAKDSNP